MDADQPFADVPIDAVRDFWNTRPCNIRHSPKEVGTREYFDEVEHRKYFVEPHIPAFRRVRPLEGSHGAGDRLRHWAPTRSTSRAPARSHGYRFVGEVRATRAAAAGGLRAQRSRHDSRRQRRGAPVILAPQTFDLVYSFGVIHHSPHPRRIVEHVRRYMGPASELRLMVYARVSYKLFWIMKEENIWDMSRIDELIARNSEAQTGCPVTYTYTDDTAGELLAGFRSVDVRKAHIFTWDVDAYGGTSIARRPSGRTSATPSWPRSSRNSDGIFWSARRSPDTKQWWSVAPCYLTVTSHGRRGSPPPRGGRSAFRFGSACS